MKAELVVPVLSGEYKHQVELLKKSVFKENEHKGFALWIPAEEFFNNYCNR